MTDTQSVPSLHRSGLRGRLTSEHARLEKLFGEARAAFDADAREDAARLWGEIDRDLTAHLDFEEQQILPAFRALDPREADALLREHDLIRRRLLELDIGVDLHLVRAEIVADFIALLRAHARREDALLYRWAERELPEAVQAQLRAAPAPTEPATPRRARAPGGN